MNEKYSRVHETTKFVTIGQVRLVGDLLVGHVSTPWIYWNFIS